MTEYACLADRFQLHHIEKGRFGRAFIIGASEVKEGFFRPIIPNRERHKFPIHTMVLAFIQDPHGLVGLEAAYEVSLTTI